MGKAGAAHFLYVTYLDAYNRAGANNTPGSFVPLWEEQWKRSTKGTLFESVQYAFRKSTVGQCDPMSVGNLRTTAERKRWFTPTYSSAVLKRLCAQASSLQLCGSK